MHFANEELNTSGRRLQSVDEEARKRVAVDFQDADGDPLDDFPIVLVKVD